MTEQKHTPGPWFVDASGDFLDVCAGKSHICALGLAPAPDWPVEEAEETNANAYLIAAAPELLAALKDASTRLRGAGMLSDTDEIRTAIAKAEGRP